MGTKAMTSTAVMAAALLLGLVGCAGPFGTDMFRVAQSPVSARAGSPINLIPGVGHVVSASEAVQINQNHRIEEKAYQLASGEWVVTNPNVALPEIVTQDVSARVLIAVAAAKASGVSSDDGIIAVHHAAELASGRQIVIVTPCYSYALPPGGVKGTFWIAYSGAASAHARLASQKDALAAADAFVSAQQDPAAWDIASD